MSNPTPEERAIAAFGLELAAINPEEKSSMCGNEVRARIAEQIREAEAIAEGKKVGAAPMSERGATLAAALVLLNEIRKTPYQPNPKSALTDQLEKTLFEELQAAQSRYDAFRAARASWIGLDQLLPGWQDLDVSDHLPREKWHAFVSNSKAEWVEWLAKNGVERKKAKTLVEEQWRKS